MLEKGSPVPHLCPIQPIRRFDRFGPHDSPVGYILLKKARGDRAPSRPLLGGSIRGRHGLKRKKPGWFGHETSPVQAENLSSIDYLNVKR